MFLFRLIGRVIGFFIKSALFVGAIVVVAAGTMYALFDAEQYKRALTKHVVDVTGRTIAVNGPVVLEFGLPPRIVLNDVRVGNPRWSRRLEMGRIKQVKIEVNPLRALSGENSIGEMRLEGADVILEANAAGQGNWQLAQVAPAAATGIAFIDALGLLGAPTSIVLSNPVINAVGGGIGGGGGLGPC